jgi:hypothetical protein
MEPEGHCRIHKSSPSLAPILSQMNAVHTFSHCFPNIHSNIILPSTSRFSEWSFPFNFSYDNF